MALVFNEEQLMLRDSARDFRAPTGTGQSPQALARLG